MAFPSDQNQRPPAKVEKPPRESRPSAPVLPPPEQHLEYLSTGVVRPVQLPVEQHSAVHFLVHDNLPEVRAYADARGWLERGYTQLSIPWQEMHWTTDGWRTARVLKSTDVPSPVVNGYFHLPRVAPGTQVEFAIRVGVSCRCPQDSAGLREEGELWLNNGGRNYQQVTR